MTVDELIEELAIEEAETERTLTNIESLSAQFSGREPNVHEMAALATYVRDVYNGFENVLLRFIRFKQIARPESADWHVNLFLMFGDPSSYDLPILIPNDLIDPVREYRGFRHVVHKRYVAHLDWARLRPLVESSAVTFRALHRNARVAAAALRPLP